MTTETWSKQEIEQGFAIRKSKGKTLVIYSDGKIYHYSKTNLKKDYLKKTSHSGKFKKTDIDKVKSKKTIDKLYDWKMKQEANKELALKHKEMNSASYIKQKYKNDLELQYQLDEDRRWDND